jgi:capsular polysaccharide transport system ATP-binding protein
MIRVSGMTKVYPFQGQDRVILDDLNFEVPPGMRLAVMGRNGAGKSTLIRLLGKVEAPTRGTVEHRMSVSWPLGFSGSFQGSLSGLDNAKFIARIYRVDYPRLLAFVREFSELDRYLYAPVKTYSSGMRARLAFALSLAVEFDCYLIDEVMLVGDQRFHARCKEQLFRKRTDRALIMASHNTAWLCNVCDAAILLIDGKAHWFNNVRQAAGIYTRMCARPVAAVRA